MEGAKGGKDVTGNRERGRDRRRFRAPSARRDTRRLDCATFWHFANANGDRMEEEEGEEEEGGAKSASSPRFRA